LSTKAPTDEDGPKPKFLGVHNAGITKKKKTKAMSRQQRLRQEKGMERADSNSDKLANKIAKSKGRAKAIDLRRVGPSVLPSAQSCMLTCFTGGLGGPERAGQDCPKERTSLSPTKD